MKNSHNAPLLCLYWFCLFLFVTPHFIPTHAYGGSLTFSEAIDTALRHNPQIQAAKGELEAITQRAIQARSGLLPQIDISETYNRTTSPLWAFGTKLNQGAITTQDFNPERLNDPDTIDNFKTVLSLSWHLFDGGQTWIAWQQARQNKEAGQLALTRTEQEVISQTTVTYVGYLLAEENQNVVEQALKTAQAHLKVVEDRERSGLAVRSDVLRAQVRIGDLEQQRLEAESGVRVTLAALGVVMGRPEAVSDDIKPEGVFKNCIPLEGTLNEWITKALARRPDLKQMQIQEAMAARQVERVRAAHFPMLALQGNYEINSENYEDTTDNYTVGAVVQMNLYSGHRISAQSAEARSILSKIQAMRRGLELKVRLDAQQAFYTAQSSWQSIQVAQTAVDQAGEGLRIVANRYQNGLLSLVSLLDAQVALQEAQTRHFKAMHNYKVARISLALAGGVIDKDFE